MERQIKEKKIKFLCYLSFDLKTKTIEVYDMYLSPHSGTDAVPAVWNTLFFCRLFGAYTCIF